MRKRNKGFGVIYVLELLRMPVDIFREANLSCDFRKKANFRHLFGAKIKKLLARRHYVPPVEIKIKELAIAEL